MAEAASNTDLVLPEEVLVEELLGDEVLHVIAPSQDLVLVAPLVQELRADDQLVARHLRLLLQLLLKRQVRV